MLWVSRFPTLSIVFFMRFLLLSLVSGVDQEFQR